MKWIEKSLRNMTNILRTEAPAADYKKVLIGIIAVFHFENEGEWEKIKKSETSEEVLDLINGFFARYDMKNVMPSSLSRMDRDILQSILEGCEEIKGNLIDIYEFCLNVFAKIEGHRGGSFYTPESVHILIRELFHPEEGDSVYDPCCGAGLAFFKLGKGIRCFGQEKDPDIWLMTKIAANVQNVSINLGEKAADTLKNDLHANEKYDFVISNPPFNVRNTGSIPNDGRWLNGIVPDGRTENYRWLEHMFSHLDKNGQMACVLTTPSLTSNDASDKSIRKLFIENGYVDAVIVLPRGLFYSNSLPCCIWIMRKEKTDHVLFINSYDALDYEQIKRIAECWEEFRNGGSPVHKRFCAVASVKEIAEHDYSLSPNAYISFSSQHNENDKVSYISIADACVIKRGYAVRKTDGKYSLYGSSDTYAMTDKKCSASETILIGRKGSIGNPRYVHGDFGVADTSYYISSLVPELNLKYLYFFLKTIDFSAFDNGSGMPSLDQKAFISIMIPVPDISYQQVVADALNDVEKSAHDSAIAAEACADLLISMYKKTDFAIEKHDVLHNVAKIKSGRTPSSNGYVPIVNAAVLKHHIVTRFAGRTVAKVHAPAESLFVSYKLSMGRVGFAPVSCTWNKGIALLETASEEMKLYLFCYLNCFEWDGLPSTSSLGRAINLEILGNIDIPVPSSESLNVFCGKVLPIYNTMIDNAKNVITNQLRLSKMLNAVFEYIE